MKKIIILIFSTYLFLSLSYSQHAPVRNFSNKITGGGNQNWEIIQRKNDWMYFANNNGLLEFDGSRWNLYPIDNHTNVRSLYYEASEDYIYAGAFNEFGYYALNDKGFLEYYSLIHKVNLSDRIFTEIWNIVHVDKSIYFQSDFEIFQYKNDTIQKFSFPNKINCTSNVHNTLLISDLEGVKMLSGNIFIQLPNSSILKGKKVCAILPLEDNKVLFVTDFHGLYIFDGEKISAFPTDIDKFLKENQVFSAAIDNHILAIGTVRNGLVVKDLISNSNIFSNVHSELQNNTILSLSFDNQKNIWLGLDKGIDYVMINLPFKELLENNKLYGTGYTSIVKDDLLYLGTNQGLYTTPYPFSNDQYQLKVTPIPKMQGQVWSLNLIDNTLFCGTDHGTFIIEGNQAHQIKHISGTWNFVKLQSQENYILGSSYQGFFLLKKQNNQWDLSHFIKGFDDSGGMFEEDEYGNIWFAHWMKGFFKLKLNDNLDEFQVEAFDESKGFYTTRNSILFKIDNKVIFSSDGGFFKYSRDENKVVHAQSIEKIFGVLPYSIKLKESENGDIWNVSTKGVQIASKQADDNYTLKEAFYASLNDKLIPGFYHLNILNDSIAIINTENGFSWFNVAEMDKQINDSLKVQILQIQFTNTNDSILSGLQTFNNKIPKFKYKLNSIRFNFTAPLYSDKNAVNYSYYLENYDSDWSSYATANSKEYTKLPHGNFVFRVRAMKTSDNSVYETHYRFIILPPWYKTTYAYILYTAIAFCILILILAYFKRRSERMLNKVTAQYKAEALEKEKEIIELKNHKMQYELRNKARDLAGTTMNLVRKNEILLDINLKINKAIEEVKENKEPAVILKRLTKIEGDIKKNIERDDNWKKFEENFDLVYENFLSKLNELFPNLSMNEKKLCAYLKMGLRSKDIAPLLNLSYRSVEMNRYRLRKKFNLERDENLVDFLDTI